MTNDVDQKKNKITRIIIQERESVAEWIKNGLTLPEIYVQLQGKYPDIRFSKSGFLRTFRNNESDLYSAALDNRGYNHYFIRKNHIQIKKLIHDGHSLKETYNMFRTHMSYNTFIYHLKKLDPDLHSLGRLRIKKHQTSDE
ncbi:TPA: hypothetical protein ACW0I5_004359 [Escherichia coli]